METENQKEVNNTKTDISNNISCTKTKKTWQELRQVVRTVRRQLSNISAKVPSSFSFKQIINSNGSQITRLYFLSTLTSGRETTLLYADIPSSTPSMNGDKLVFSWQPMLQSSFQAFPTLGRFSREEQLQWERKRLVLWGITSYDFHPSYGRFIFPACGSVFFCDDNGILPPPFFPQELKTSSQSARLNPQMCPWNPDLVAYVCNFDLWVCHIKTFSEVRLTYVRKGSTSISDDPSTAGIPSYVTQEEFNRYTGYWWQQSCYQKDGIYRILYEEVDESDVEILCLPNYIDERETEQFRFPRAGTSNARSTLKIAQFSLSETGFIENVIILHLSEPLQEICPNFEYLVRAGWTEDGKFVWVQLLERHQSRLSLVLIPLSAFVLPDHMEDLTSNHINCSPITQVIYEERSDIWINVHDIFYTFSQEKDNELTFLWASEETGFRHLYLITVKLLLEGYDDIIDSHFMEPREVGSNILKKVALTSGKWEVSEQDVWVDTERRLVYFIGLMNSPLERHLYVISLDNPKEPQRLTVPEYSHVVAMNKECTMFVTIQSKISQAPFGEIFQLQFMNDDSSKLVDAQPLGYLLEPTALDSSCPQPEIFHHQISGQVVYGMVFKPPNLQPDAKYPTVLTIYGGPEVQVVTNTFKGMRHLRYHLLAAEGYVVVAIDSRGSRYRGLNFESHIKERMGTVEILDQVEILAWLSKTVGYIDLTRVAIHGWSYGGYLSLMGLAQRPDIFKLAVAGAPVTSWLLYDTGYTERYMNTPLKNTSGYSSGSVLSYVNLFPDEENRLLIIHGLMDENVHFSHTSQLINALIKAGKPYQLQIYPTERHSLRHLDACEHYETTLLSFLQQHL